jgi:hypothetical protein
VNLYVVLCRVFENVIVVGIIPRTRFACRATGHCPAGPPLWELSRIIYPGGLYTQKRMDDVQSFGYMESDPLSAVWTVFGVLIISAVLLIAQVVALNRSYLSIAAYHSLEWELVSKGSTTRQPKVGKSNSVAFSNTQQQTAALVWEGKRKYAKGELVYYPDLSGALYQARVNSPEGHPSYNGYRVLGEQLLSELGHPATSRLVANLATLQFATAFAYFALWAILNLLGFYLTAHGLVWAVISHFVAIHGVLSITRSSAHFVFSKQRQKQPSNAMLALQKLNGEILKRNY